MILYNIHTHNILTDVDTRYSVFNILNTTPSQFEEGDHISTKYYSVGLHPWYLSDAEYEIAILEKIIQDSSIIAIGEAGLDFLNGGDHAKQEFYFRKQIDLSEKTGKPLIIHCVKAWDKLISIHKEYTPISQWIIHGFRGKPQQALQLQKQGIKFSFGFNFNSETLHAVSPESIFCETDEYSASVYTIYHKLSEELGLDFIYFAKKIEVNVKNTFLLL